MRPAADAQSCLTVREVRGQVGNAGECNLAKCWQGDRKDKRVDLLGCVCPLLYSPVACNPRAV